MSDEPLNQHVVKVLKDPSFWGFEKLLKTGGYRKHTKKTVKTKIRNKEYKNVIDPSNMKRKQNDFSFNYSEALFDIDLGVKKITDK